MAEETMCVIENFYHYICYFIFADSNNWRTYIPSLSEMPKSWPGVETEDGLRTEHLTPDCEPQQAYTF